MSAIVLQWRRDGASVEPAEFAAMMAALAYRGPDGATTLTSTTARLGVWQHWTTPEDDGKPLAVRHTAAGFDLAWDGRVDNREELAAALGHELQGPAHAASDAELVAAAYARWREGCFSRLVGPFAAAVVDHRRSLVVCARDPLGDRTLVWARCGGLLAVASEERSLLTQAWVADDPDEAAIAAYLAGRAPAPGATFFADIRELPPAHLLVFDGHSVRLDRYWELDVTPIGHRTDGEYVEHFASVLRASVHCRLRSRSRAAVLMSGGLDSTSVAALAAEAAAGDASRRPLAVSWVFDELPGADERRWIAAMAAAVDLESVLVAGDDAWPLRPVTDWFDDANMPIEDPYRILHERAYAAAREGGATVVLGGDGGDQLYLGGEFWLADLVRAGRLAATARELAAHAWWHGVRRRPTRASARRVVARAFGIQSSPWRPAPAAPSWLTERAAELLSATPAAEHAGARTRCATDEWLALGLKAERPQAARAGVEMRRPFRDRRLVELAVRLPGHVLHRPGRSKWILRRAMGGLLPESVLRRSERTSLLPLYARGLAERELAPLLALLRAPGATWSNFVRPEWMWQAIPASALTGRDGLGTVVPWYSASLEQWTRKLSRGARARATVVPGEQQGFREVA